MAKSPRKKLYQPGDRVLTLSGQDGTIQNPPWFMPFHALVKIDDGPTIWLPKDGLIPF